MLSLQAINKFKWNVDKSSSLRSALVSTCIFHELPIEVTHTLQMTERQRPAHSFKMFTKRLNKNYLVSTMVIKTVRK